MSTDTLELTLGRLAVLDAATIARGCARNLAEFELRVAGG